MSIEKKRKPIQKEINVKSIIKNDQSNKHIINIFIIACLTLFTYYNSINNDYNLDDEYITNSLPSIDQGFLGALSMFTKPYNTEDYRPVVTFSYAVEQLIFGLNPHTSHTINLLLFTILCLSIYLVLSKLPIKNIRAISFAVAILFSVHTSHTEVVCSIKNRDNILSMLFGIWSLYYFCKANLSKNKKEFLLSLFLLFLGFLSKLDVIAFVFIIPLTLFIFYNIKLKKTVLTTLFLSLVLLIRNIILNKLSTKLLIGSSVSFTENPLSANPTFLNKISQAIQSISYYIKFMIIPKGYYYYFGYDMIPLKNLFSLEIILLFLANIFILFIAIFYYKKNKLVTYGILFFYASLIYALNIIVLVSGIVAVRYSFIASLGFCIVLVTFLFLISEKISALRNIKNLIFYEKIKSHLFKVLILCVVLYYLPFTIYRNKDWKDINTLIAADISDMKNSFEGNRIAASHVLVNAVYGKDTAMNRILFKQGLSYALNAQKLYEKNNYVNEMVAQAYYNLKNINYAKKTFLKNIKYNDTSTVSLEYLGNIYFVQEQQFDSAAYYYKKIIDAHPDYEGAYFKYLNASYKAGKKSEILNYYTTQYNKKQNGYIPAQCIAYYYFFEKDSTAGMIYFKESFKQGYFNKDAARFAQEYFLQHNNIPAAKEMNQYLLKGL